MNYKELFHKILVLLSAPGKAWEEIKKENERDNILTGFVYPLIGVCGLAEFAGTFIERGISPDVFQYALQSCCAVAVALFGGFFLIAYLLERMGKRWFGSSCSREMIQTFTGYSLVVTFVLNAICPFFQLAILRWLLQLYTLFIVFEGARRYLDIKEAKLTSYTLVATVLILLCPALIEFIFNKLSVILN